MQRIAGNGGISVAALEVAGPDGNVGRVSRYIKIPLAPATTDEELTGFKLPANCLVLPHPFVKVRTGAGTVEIGTAEGVGAGGGDLDGLIDGLSVATAGEKSPVLANGAETLGALLKETSDSGKVRKPFVVGDTALEVTVKASDATFRGDVYIEIIEAF